MLGPTYSRASGRMRRGLLAVALSLLAVVLSLLAAATTGCSPSSPRPHHPVGRWEYAGELPDGQRGLVRVEIQPGPFLKYLGFREHLEPLAEKHASKLAADLEQRWRTTPEMLVQYRKPWFQGYGGVTDGVDFFRYDEVTETLTSAREDSLGKVFHRVEQFRPFRFPISVSASPPQRSPTD